MLSLAGGLPDPALFPVQELAAIADRVLRLRSGEIVEDTRNENPISAMELIW